MKCNDWFPNGSARRPGRGIYFQPTAILCALCAFVSAARGATLVHDFYLPMPEAQIKQSFDALETGVGTTLDSVFSVVITGEGTVIYYDQWEDGYEINLAGPAQSTTKIWGDGNNANGIPPGYTNDPPSFPAGTVLALRNLVPLPRNPSTLLFDARDRMAATKALVVSRAGWATSPGSVLSGAVEVTATIDFGTSYISPVGQDLTNGLFQYVGFMVMAEQDNTSVSIDPDGPGSTTPTVVVLNRGESHLMNGGVKKGGSVNASKPVQVNLVIGRKGARYATDWYTLYPTNDWSDCYTTPVGTANNNNAAYVYVYNPGPSNLTVNYATTLGPGSFSVASNGVTQFQMPKNSGARFTSVGGRKFFALSTVGASPGSDAAYDWGFTLLPDTGLTTEAVVGWGPGSSTGSVNGSPVWVTVLANSRVYVDYNGDRAGSLTDPLGGKYDAHFDLTALASQKIYDPDLDQTAMRLYTLSGTPINAAWGEDPDVASPGNPYLDFGTTVLPFPVPLLQKTSRLYTDTAPPGLSIGDVIEYTVRLDNRGLLPLGNVLVLDTLPGTVSYVTNTTTYNSSPLADNGSGTPFPLDAPGYTIPVILRDGSSVFTFRVTALTNGVMTNVVNAAGYSLVANNVIAPSATPTVCSLAFTDSTGTNTVFAYTAGSNLFVRLADNDANTVTNSVQTVSVIISNATRGDFESVTLTETGNNTGIFRNASGLASSTSTGNSQQDGTLNAQAGDLIMVSRVDPIFGDTCSASAVISIPARSKILYLSDPGQELDRIDPVATADGTTAQTIDLGLGASTITAGNVSSTGRTATASVTLAHTTAAGANRLLMVSIAYVKDQNTRNVTSVTYGGQSFTQKATQSDGDDELAVDLWYLVNPNVGTTNVVVTLNNSVAGITVGASSFTGVDSATPLGTAATAEGNDGSGAGSPSVVVTSAAGELVFDAVARDNTDSLTVGAGQTEQLNTIATGQIRGAASTEAGGANVTMSWTSGNTSEGWATIGVGIKPAPGGGTNFTVFTQAPSFCSDFVMPAGGAIAITNFVTVISGSPPANPAVTATLRRGGVNFLTLTNAAYDSGASNIVWTGTLTSNVTVASGQAISLVLTTAQSGATFRVDFDSATKPSKISLPTSTVIDIGALAVYDAPYPGGSIVSSPPSGSTLFIRADVSDPFGSYDISSLGLVIDGPGTNSDLSVTLNNAQAVATNSCAKTYEYVWQTGVTPGGYNITATANEGTEGITDTASTGVTLTFLDTGTPSATEFTSGNNGSPTNAFPQNSSACVRVTDLDQNTNPALAETVSVTITSGSGDSENVVLTETGTNTGVFTACVPTSTSGGGGANNGTLNAPVSSILTVTYTDPDDSGDTSGGTSTILPPAATSAVTMNKTLVAPADGQAGVGETVQYNLQVVNSGSTVLTNISVTDNFPSNRLSYVSASLTPDSVGGGTLTWANVGPLGVGQSTNILVTFTASSAGAGVVNTAIANAGGGATNISTAGLTITHAALTLTKTLLNPTNGPIAIGSNITFRIVAQNTGDTPIPTLPLQDTFSAGCFQFVSATVTPDGTGAGSLLWNDITGSGSLATNDSLTIDVTLKAVGGCDPANNSAHADYAVDSNGDPVPPASSTVGVTTTSARITGRVYNDADQSGTLTGGDTGLAGVTIELFTDPNADGNPADGALAQLTATDGTGYYELLNLATGAYVVVETDLPGYASSFPVNNRLALNFTTLSTNANNNFFDYIPAVTNYATVGGTVYFDANLNGTNNVGETGISNVLVELVQDVNTNGLADLGEPAVAFTYTLNDGAYSFINVTPGNYVIRETDIFGYASTGDTRPPNDNQIGLLVAPGATTNGNDFFDYSAGNTPGNDAPVAVGDSYSTPEDTQLVVPANGVLTNDTDADNDALIAVLVSPTTNGVLNLNTNGSFTYTPNSNYSGGDSFTYRANDGTTNSSIATVFINVTPVNDAPFANGQNVTTPEDTSTNLVLTGFDVESSPLTFIIVTGPTNGVLTSVNTNTGAVTYQPNTNYNGGDSFTFRVNDGSSNSAIATVFITVTPVNDAPLASDQSVVTPEDTSTNLVLVGSDIEGPVTYSILNGPTNGVLSGFNTNTGAITYSPNTNFNGGDSFTFRVSDGSLFATGTVFITVTPLNDGPNANNQSVTTPEDTATNLFLVGSDIEVAVTYSILTGPTNGVLSGFNTNTGAITYSPNTNFNGGDSFTFRVSDGSLFATGTVFVTVTPVNDLPVANGQNVITPEDTSTNLVLTASDADGNSLTYIIVTGPTNGVLTSVNTNTGSVTYQPNTNYTGGDSFTFRVNDGTANSGIATVGITVTPVNDVPLAFNQNVTTPEDTTTNLVLVGSDIEGPVTYALLTSPTNGSAFSLNPVTGAVTYQPNPNYSGPDAFRFTETDGSLFATGTVFITVTPINDGPIANNQSATTPEDTATNLFLIGSDVEGPVVYSILSSPTNGALSGFDTNTGAITYTPSTNYNGPDSFSFTVSDGSLLATGTVFITVTPVNDAPVAINDSYAIFKNAVLTVVVSGVLTNDFDADGNPLTALIVAGPTNAASFTLNPNGSFTYTPLSNYTGLDMFTYRATDGSATSAVATATITISSTNFAPVAFGQNVTTPEDTATNLTLVATDPDGNPLTYIIVTSPTNGVLSLVNTNAGTLTYTPNTNFSGGDSFTFQVSDGFTTSGVATVGITVMAVNDGPVADNQAVVTPENTATNLTLTGGDLESAVTFAILNGPTNGALSGFNPTSGAVTYSPSNNYVGPDFFRFTVSDGSLLATGTVSITVTPGDPAQADVAVFKTGSVSGAAGANLNYTITVTNLGLATATNVVVQDQLPAGFTYISAVPSPASVIGNLVSWPAFNLVVGISSNFTVTARASEGGSYTNIAFSTSSTGDPNPTNNSGGITNSQAITSVTPSADVAVLKTGAGSVFAGSNLTYTITVTNNGPSTATNIVVQDSLPATLTFVSASGGGTLNLGVVAWPAFALPVGVVSNFTVTATAPASGSFTNIALSTSGTPDPNPTNNNGTLPPSGVTTTVTPLADVAVLKAGSTNVVAGGTLVYTISATNNGPSTATNVVVQDQLPAALTFQSASGGGAFNTGVVTWAAFTLPVGVVSNFTVTATAPASGSFTNIALGTSGTTDPNPTNNSGTLPPSGVTTTVTPSADVAIFKTGPASAVAGSNITFTIMATNRGPSSATNVAVQDQMPVGFVFVSAVPSPASVAGNLVTWPPFSLLNGGSSNFAITVRVAEGGNYTNIALSTSDTPDPNPTNNNGTLPPSTTGTTITPSADVAVFKTGSGSVLAGGTVVYTITATNHGPSTATNVVVQDRLPAGATFVSASGSYTINTGVVTWAGISLPVGAPATFTVTVTAPAGGSFTNIALGTSGTPDPNPTNNNGTLPPAGVSTTVTPVADLAVFKTGPLNVTNGQSFSYTITLTNRGPSTATGVVVQDLVPTSLTFVSASAGGTFATNRVTWPTIATFTNGATTNFTLTVTANALGSLTNIANATAATLDSNSTNNNGSSASSQAATTVVPAGTSLFGWSLLSSVFNPQTGLYEKRVAITNNTGSTVNAMRVYATGLPATVFLLNASGTNAGKPYVHYNVPLADGASVTLLLEFLSTDRRPFTNGFEVEAVLPIVYVPGNGTSVTNLKIFMETYPGLPEPHQVLEFPSIPGRWYMVLYGDAGVNSVTNIATPNIRATANKVQWIDAGPPKTATKPSSRFYRVILLP